MSCKQALERLPTHVEICDVEYVEKILGGHTDEPLDLASNSSSSSIVSDLEDFLYLYADDNS